jgi:hypothetical protein
LQLWRSIPIARHFRERSQESENVSEENQRKEARRENHQGQEVQPAPREADQASIEAERATITDTVEAGFKYPAINALRIAERRGYKTNVIKKDGELTRYTARRSS